MLTPTYSFRGSDGATYSGTLDQLRQWSTEGRVSLDEFITDASTGRQSILRDVLYPVQVQPAQAPAPTPFGAYPRGVYAAPAAPDNIGSFHWGAFSLNWIWGLNHRQPITLLIFLAGCIPFGGLIFAIWVGMKGNQWAWESGRFSTPDECKACQAIWTKWGVGLLIFNVVVAIGFVALSVLLPMMANH